MSFYVALIIGVLAFFGLSVVGEMQAFAAFAVSLVLAFLPYALSNIPRRHRKFGLGHIEQMLDHRRGHFDRAYSEDPIPPEHGLHGDTGRNDRCPCGSGKKYKRCHGRSARLR